MQDSWNDFSWVHSKLLKFEIQAWNCSPFVFLNFFFTMDSKPQQQSTYALTLFQYKAEVDGQDVEIDFWDTAGQERFNNVHPSYYHRANACILVFDTTRKPTYKNLEKWFSELKTYREDIPCIVVGNKIDSKL